MYFKETQCYIEGNPKLREPQVEAYLKIQNHFENNPEEPALVVLPTGTGKSGLISIAPFGVSDGRVLIITPGKVTKKSIAKTMDPLEDNFWINTNVIFNIEELPVLVSYEKEVLDNELQSANIIYTNVQKLNIENPNSLLNRVPRNFFDMIIVDEAHHAPANTWQEALRYFNKSKVLHVTGTPFRGDGVEVPGKKIHETKLSQVMDAKYVKWLRNKTLTFPELCFYDENMRKLTVEEAKELHDEDWIKRSIAMSDECTMKVIESSIEELNEIKKHSSNVPHKIMAAACNITHAEKVQQMYVQAGVEAIVIHSKLPPEEQENRFKEIELNKCDVVVNVGMMAEGYDHKYLTVAAIFRPYKSLNMFAQIIGRVLRAIPNEEIIDFEIDNNAIVIYNKELGLDELWDYFKKETEIVGKFKKVKEIEFPENLGGSHEITYGVASAGTNIIEFESSYSSSIDFNEAFEQAKSRISDEIQSKRKELESLGWNSEDIEAALCNLSKGRTKKTSEELDKIYNEKRPLERRKIIKKSLNDKVKLLASSLLNEYGIDEKNNNLYIYFRRVLPPTIPSITLNDGVIVIYINIKLKHKIGQRDLLDINDLIQAENYLDEIETELRGIFNGIQSN